MASKYHDDWQSSKKTVLQRNAFMFNNELMSDVSFVCGESSRIFHAHKYVLATSSAVFFDTFYRNLARKEYPIRVSDADEESFKEFLRFLYTDDCKLTAENTIRVMCLAKKYFVSSLEEKCCEFLGASIKPDNVFVMLEQAVKFDAKELEAKCWEFVSRQTRQCLNTKAFCEIGLHTLNALLKKKTFGITEVELFQAILKWADSECTRQGLNIKDDKMARRRVLGDSVYEIRFLAISLENLVKYVSPTGVLTETEVVSITQKLQGLDVAELKWKENKKRQPRILSFSRFDPTNVHCNFYRIFSWYLLVLGSGSQALTLVVNKAVLFHGVRLLGDTQGSQYEAKITIRDKNVTGTYRSEKDNDNVPGYDVMLPDPISLLPNKEHTIIATVAGPASCYGTSGIQSLKTDDIVVTFKNSGTWSTRDKFYKIFLSQM